MLAVSSSFFCLLPSSRIAESHQAQPEYIFFFVLFFQDRISLEEEEVELIFVEEIVGLADLQRRPPWSQ